MYMYIKKFERDTTHAKRYGIKLVLLDSDVCFPKKNKKNIKIRTATGSKYNKILSLLIS